MFRCISIIVAIANVALLATSALAQTTLRMSVSIPQNSHYGNAVDAFASEVEKRTSSRYKIQNFYASALGAEREATEGVQLGTIDLTLTSTGPIPNFVPEVAILDIPFLFRDKAHAQAVLDGPLGQEMLTKFDAKGFKALAWGENGFRHMTNSKHPVNSPADLKGLKLRTMENPIHIQAYKGFGLIPTPMAISEVFTALQQGTVDGQENPISSIQGQKFDQVQKYLSLTGHVYSPAVFLMNKTQFEKLSAADKEAFLEAAKVAVKANRARVEDDDQKGVAYFRSKGMEVVENVDKSKFQEVLKPAFVEFSKRFGEANIERIRNFK